MKKTVYLLLALLLAGILLFFLIVDNSKKDSDLFAQCLVDSDLIVYVTDTCPACSDFAKQLGGYDVVEGLFVNCNEQMEKCETEKQTGFVPEIQYKGELYEGSRSMKDLAELTDCDF